MKAAVTKEYGQVTIEEVETPTPKSDELLIKVMATTVNRTDCHNMSGEPFIMKMMLGLKRPKRAIQGTDFAGVVAAVGENVTRFAVGDRLFGFYDSGLSSHAEYLCIKDNAPLSKIPDSVPFADAAAVIEGFHYALNFINKVKLQKGETVLVHGATGAIGSAVLQLCFYEGAIVTATCRAEHEEMIKKLGAVETIDYTTVDYATLEKKYDYVFDAVGKSSFGKAKAVLNEKGIYISSELGNNSENLFLSLYSLLFGKKKVKFPLPLDNQKSLDLAAELFESGKLTALIDKRYRLDAISEAYAYAESGAKVGSLIVENF